MGTTRTALQTGSGKFVWVVAIEGYGNLLTSGDTSAAVTAWSGTDWSAALGGLFVDLRNEQSISPWEPLNGGGRCTLTITPDAADTFGIATHRKSADYESELTAELDRDDATVYVQSASSFASSGTIYIGTEAIGYTGRTQQSFTGCTRGKWSPFAAGGSETTRFAQHHRVGEDANSVKLQPIVSSQPRIWVGKWVGVWLHRVVDGVLDVKAQAQLVFAGKIVEIRDDPNSFGTVVELKHVLDVVRDHTIGRQMWRGNTNEGVYVPAGRLFRLLDQPAETAAIKSTNDLTVVASGASGTNQMNAGIYTYEQLHDKINQWFVAELAAARIYGTYHIDDIQVGASTRTSIEWRIPYASSVRVGFDFILPHEVSTFFGFSSSQAKPVSTDAEGTFVPSNHLKISQMGNYNVWNRFTGDDPALRTVVFHNVSSIDAFSATVQVTDESGEFIDQYATIPAVFKPSSALVSGATYEWGMFILDNKLLLRAAYVPGDPSELRNCFVPPFAYAANVFYTGAEAFEAFKIPIEGGGQGSFEIRQVLVSEASLANMLAAIFYSTGTEGYNSADYDLLGFGGGIGIPAGLLGDMFESSLAALPGADQSLVVVVDKPHKISDLFEGDLVLRRAFLSWRDGGLRFGSWKVPTSETAVHSGNGTAITLTESNKSEPSGHTANQRSATTQSDEWQRPVIKILYNRDFTDLASDGFRSSLTFEDKTAVDDAGGDAGVLTVKARNTYSQFVGTGAGIEDLAPGFLATMPLFSRPARRLRRSIDVRYFEGLSVGDVVLFTDAFSRDPATGERSITNRPAVVVKHSWSPGGAVFGSDDAEPMTGEIELFFTDAPAELSSGLYAPSADVDNTVSTGGFDAGYASGTKTLRCVARRYNQTTSYFTSQGEILNEEAADASYFVAGAKVRVIERDPTSAAAPLYWDDVVVSQSSNDIVLTTGLAGWDNTKQYVVIQDDYADATTAQKLKVYQADDADGRIVNLSSPYQYAAGSGSSSYEDNPTVLPEIISTSLYQDGAGRCTYADTALARLADNLIDYKRAIQSPWLFNTAIGNTNASYAGTFVLVAVKPIYLGQETLSSTVLRELVVAPWYRSTDGTTATIRVTLSSSMPRDARIYNVSRGTIYSEHSWSTSSTTWSSGTAAYLDCRVKSSGASGHAYLLIECSYKCETRGLSRCTETARTQQFFGVDV